MTSCPKLSRCRATHSLSVEASSRIRAWGPVPQHRREPLSAGDDPALENLPVRGENAELALALVQIKPYDIHGAWPSLLRLLTALKVVGRTCHHILWMARRFIPTMRGR
jgi:hypothetical protein